MKVIETRNVYKKNPEIISAIDLYEFFKRIPNSEYLKENEFRKNITLKVKDNDQWIDINLDKLKEYSLILEKFISKIKSVL